MFDFFLDYCLILLYFSYFNYCCIIILNVTDEIGHTGYYFPILEITEYKDKIDSKNLFDQPIRNDIKMYENITKIAPGPEDDDCKTGFLLNSPYFKESYKLIAIDVKKQQRT